MRSSLDSLPQPGPAEIVSARRFAHPPAVLFDAFRDPVRLVQWWGPKGFRSTIECFDFRVGGCWRFTMHSPDGADFAMEHTFVVILPGRQVVFDHLQEGHTFRMTLDFLPEPEGSLLRWAMAFATVAQCEAARPVIVRANEENFDRLERHLAIFMKPQESTPPIDPRREIVITRVVKAPRALAWEAMTDPKHVVHWWGPTGFSTTIQEMDVRVGGNWIHTMRGPDGVEYPNHSVFQEVVKPERLVYNHGGKREGGPSVSFIATWLFEEVSPNETRLTIRMVFPTVEHRDKVVREFGAIEGGKQTLARLDEYLPTMVKSPAEMDRGHA